MHVQIERAHSYAVVRPAGSFYGGGETTELEHKLGALIDGGTPIVVVDLARTQDLNSSAIGVLVGAYRRSQPRGVALCLCGVDQSLLNVLTVLKLVNVLPVFPDVPRALAGMAAPARTPATALVAARFAA
jgi:anti-anti-sigma factor